MKALWVVNKYCGAMHEKLFHSKSTGGLWLDAMLEQAKNTDDRIVVVNVSNKPQIKYLEDGNISYYTITASPNEKYNYNGASEVNQWKMIFDREKPDLVELWGTEFPYGLSTLHIAPEVPHLVFVQGVLGSIGRYYEAGLSRSELKKAVTLRDFLTRKTIPMMACKYKKRSLYEEKIISEAKNVIVANHWAESYYSGRLSGLNFYYLPISLSDCFRNYSWSEEKMQKHTLMCPAADYPIKGIHMLIKALRIVKQKYPDVTLFVPGCALRKADSLGNWLKRDGYSKFVDSLLTEYNLKENVVFTGRLTAEQMAEKMSVVNCFVMPSAIENHSSTLLEAMTVGTPCIASFVGGVCEYAVHGENVLTYRFENYEMLAYNIIRLFENKEVRNTLSKNAKENRLSQTDNIIGYLNMRKIYDRMIDNK